MNEKRSRISRTLCSIFVVIICTSLVLIAFPIISAQPKPSYTSQAQLSAGVLLNKPGVSYDLKPLDEFAQEGSVNIISNLDSGNGIGNGGSQISYYIYRSHFNENLSVLIFEIGASDLPVNESKNELIYFNSLSVNIVIPTLINYDGLEAVLVPAVPIDPHALDWGEALRFELVWLQNLSIVTGLIQDDMDQIEMQATPGQEDFLSMALYENATWKHYLIPDDILKRKDTFDELPFYIRID